MHSDYSNNFTSLQSAVLLEESELCFKTSFGDTHIKFAKVKWVFTEKVMCSCADLEGNRSITNDSGKYIMLTIFPSLSQKRLEDTVKKISRKMDRYGKDRLRNSPVF